MLVEFSVTNFRSIRDRVTLSLVAEAPRKGDITDDERLIVVNEKLSLLRSAVLYGANASGKSNILDAMGVFRRMIMASSGWQLGHKLPVEPFRLRTDTRTQPSEFEVIFVLKVNDRFVQYRYGFATTKDRVHREWLFVNEGSQRETERFRRDDRGIHVGKTFEEGRGIEKNTRADVLFLPTVAALNGEEANRILNWIGDPRTNHALNPNRTALLLHKGRHTNEINRLICELDVGIASLTTSELPSTTYQASPYGGLRYVKERRNLPEEGRWRDFTDGITILSRHSIRDEHGNIVGEEDFPVDDMESSGTKRLISMTGVLLSSIAYGRLSVMDDMDVSLHPHLTAALVRLFHSPKTNPNDAQLIFATHDTNLLSSDLFRRDQIYMVQKDKQSGTMLYSLDEFKGVRQKDSYEREYLRGQFGAVPCLGDLEQIVPHFAQDESGENAEA